MCSERCSDRSTTPPGGSPWPQSPRPLADPHRGHTPAGAGPAGAGPADGHRPAGCAGPAGGCRAAGGAGPTGERGHTGRRWLATALFVAGVVALAFNLRPAITSLPPVFPELSANLGLSPATVTVLATIPVVCFGLVSGVAARLSRRFGDERALLVALIVLASCLAARGAVPHQALLPATAVAAGGVAIMNVLLSGLIKRRMPAHAGLLIGIYLLSLSVGSIIGSLISVPVYQASGGSARLVLGLWAAPAAVAAVMWLPQARRRAAGGLAAGTVARSEMAGDPAGRGIAAGTAAGSATAGDGELAGGGAAVGVTADSGAARRAAARQRASAGHAVHRHLLGWQVAGFMGLQSLAYYSTLSWLPILFRGRGATPAQAGVLISVAALGGALTSLVIPVLAHRAPDQRLLLIPTVLVSGVGIAAALYAPMSTAAFWMFVLGLGQGAALGLAIFFTMARAATPAIAASLSSLAQSAGYLLASTGPLLVGFLHTVTGAWTVPIFLLLGVTVIELLVGYLAARGRVIS